VLIDEPAVVVPGHLARGLLELAVAEAQRRAVAGRHLGAELRDLLGDLARVAREPDGPQWAAERAAVGRTAIVGGVDTNTAGEILGIDPRTVRKHIAAGKLAAEQQPDGSWLVDLGEAS